MAVHIKLHGVGLTVPHFVQKERSAKSWTSTLFAAATSRLNRGYRQLLEDINLEASEGDRIALIGRNGAGKTTLLRILAGSLQPTSGSMEVEGSRQALLNLGLGFNTEATVHENIYLRATAMGLKPREIRALVSPILEFAELGHVANHRLATLSSGQRMRLGFAISTAVQHDIMLLDEWFGAGDFGFVERARARMTDRVAGSKIVVLASHNFRMLRQVCTTGVVVESGRIAFQGPVEEAFERYHAIYRDAGEPALAAGGLLDEESALDPELSPTLALKRQLRAARQVVREQKQVIREQQEKIRDARLVARALRRKLRAAASGSPAGPSGEDGA